MSIPCLASTFSLLPSMYFCTHKASRLHTTKDDIHDMENAYIPLLVGFWSMLMGLREDPRDIFHGPLLVIGRFLISSTVLYGCKNQYLPAVSSHKLPYSLIERDKLNIHEALMIQKLLACGPIN